jgi:hypothetical protein
MDLDLVPVPDLVQDPFPDMVPDPDMFPAIEPFKMMWYATWI